VQSWPSIPIEREDKKDERERERERERDEYQYKGEEDECKQCLTDVTPFFPKLLHEMKLRRPKTQISKCYQYIEL